MMERTTTVGDMAALVPGAMDYFKEIGIDYCCGGNRRLVDAIKQAKQPEQDVFARLEQLEQGAKAQGEHQSFTQMDAAELCEYIVAKHHVYLRRVLPEIGQLLNAVMRAHGAQHQELFKLGQLFGRLRGDLEQHLLQEELLLFPALSGQDSGQAAALTPEIIAEHEAAGEILQQLSQLTQGYAVPADGCVTYEKAYKMLAEMEDDLHRHIHLENNILFKAYDVR